MSKKPSNQPPDLSDRDWEIQKRSEDKAWAHAVRRDTMAEHGLRAILLLNSGGALALLTFLQIAWTKRELVQLVPWIVIAMVPLLLGAATAGVVHFLRYWASMTYQTKGANEGRKLTMAHQVATGLSFACFFLGMSIIVCGAFRNLPQ